MGSINRYLLALATFVLFVPFGAASAQTPTTCVETEYLMTLEGICEPGQPMGQRLVVNCTGGSVHGPKINGTIIPPTGDWLVPLGEGHLRLDVRGTIKTDDGELIMFEYYGVISYTKEASTEPSRVKSSLRRTDTSLRHPFSPLLPKNMLGLPKFRPWQNDEPPGRQIREVRDIFAVR